MSAAIRVEGLCKRYSLSGSAASYRMLGETITGGVATAWRALSRLGRPSLPAADAPVPPKEIWACKDVSFTIPAGKVVGLIGRNGAGKSTILKILTRITEPTSGRVELRGRVGSLLEVGTGFHPELTGRENVYLSGTILGMRRAEINRKFDEIVAFAEIEQFLDTPVKRYSSGMYVRLAFGVAAHLEPEILLVDEVLAVGDAAFQKKCLGKMRTVAQEGRTVILVSHNMAAVTRLCNVALLLDKGQLVAQGDVEELVSRYLSWGAEGCGSVAFPDNEDAPGSEYVRLLGARTTVEGQPTSTLDARKPFTIEIEYRILRPVSNLRIGVRVLAQDGSAVFTTTDMDDSEELPRLPGRHVSRCLIPGNFLNYGQYYLTLGSDFPMSRVHFSMDQILAFHIEPTGGVGGHIPDGRKGYVRVSLPWTIEDGVTSEVKANGTVEGQVR